MKNTSWKSLYCYKFILKLFVKVLFKKLYMNLGMYKLSICVWISDMYFLDFRVLSYVFGKHITHQSFWFVRFSPIHGTSSLKSRSVFKQTRHWGGKCIVYGDHNKHLKICWIFIELCVSTLKCILHYEWIE